ncbi:BTB/POZ domain-containing protein 6-like [Oculina patagonica]
MSTLQALSKNWPMDHKERCKSLFNNEILSDVKFVVQSSRNSENGERNSKKSKIAIPAHKFLLSICSPVFFAMFCGEMAETKEHIDLPDCEYEGILELLRYIYTDEVCLNGNNVMQVLYLAEKYMIPSLTSECTEYLGKNLDLSDVFCVLKHAEQYENKDLLFHCWDLIDKETEEALKSNEFLSMERSFLNQLVERDSLKIREVELFKAVDCWAKEECKRQQLKADGSVKRQVLGEQIVKNIRFPIMKQNEFVDVVLDSNILTQHEKSDIMKYFSSTVTSVVGFPNDHRVGSLLRCCRFKSFHNVKYRFIENHPDEVDWFVLKVDKDIILHGVSILGNDGGEFTVTLNIVNGDDDDLLVSKTGTYASEGMKCNSGSYYGFNVIFDEPLAVERDVCYLIEASAEGPGHCVGNEDIDYAFVSGVRFAFAHEDYFPDPNYGVLSQSMCAELLFKVKE